MGEPRYRLAETGDAEAIAHLHAESWRRHYRGAYSDSFLDGDVVADRLAIWSERLRAPDPVRPTIVADDVAILGFAHVVFDDDPTWGSLLDNLHVAFARKRGGIGAHLLALAARAVVEREAGGGLYLWVLEQNIDAQAFYDACGGRPAGRRVISPPGGVPERINGTPEALRYVWPDPALILRCR